MMDFQQCQQTAMNLAGTVALPAPFPSCGAVSIVVALDDGDLETYLKIVQLVGVRRIVTRFVRAADIRAVRIAAEGNGSGGPETWPIVGSKVARRQVEAKAQPLCDQVSKSGSAAEIDWLGAAIVYVPEAAPVLHRNEVGVTAAVSAEDVAFGDMPSTWGSTEGSWCPHADKSCPREAAGHWCPRSDKLGSCSR
jgi:hypothetical protein